MPDLAAYRATPQERARTADLLALLPEGRRTVLDVGARDGHFSLLLADRFAEVTALDLRPPAVQHPKVRNVAGDATRLDFGDGSFDVVFCAEVLEHIPDVEAAGRELARVARHEIIVGVPYRQDTRVGRMTCRACGSVSPPWGHVQEFDEGRLAGLFPGWAKDLTTFVGTNRERTNEVAAWLMDRAGNPWGTYDDEARCGCGAPLDAAPSRTLPQKFCSKAALLLQSLQTRLSAPHGNWIHMRLRRVAPLGIGAAAAAR
ncbi:MAG: class I SAM-dependent methyltransferase [Bryobacteraceae bacterium]|nr:class I SAM-dependent methyltransferase [Bryobacteraceae bacterium]